MMLSTISDVDMSCMPISTLLYYVNGASPGAPIQGGSGNPCVAYSSVRRRMESPIAATLLVCSLVLGAVQRQI